jgi:hypothetical protein
MQKAVQLHNESEQHEAAAKWVSLSNRMLIFTFFVIVSSTRVGSRRNLCSQLVYPIVNHHSLFPVGLSEFTKFVITSRYGL